MNIFYFDRLKIADHKYLLKPLKHSPGNKAITNTNIPVLEKIQFEFLNGEGDHTNNIGRFYYLKIKMK